MNIHEIMGVKFPTVAKYKHEVPCLNPDLVIGYELEIEKCDDQDHYSQFCKNNNIITKEDGSLRGQAFEFITKPMRSANALAAIQNLLTYAEFGERNYTDRTSVHVHVNCTDLTPDQCSAVSLLYCVFEEIFFEFVGKERGDNIYCIPWSQCRNHLNLVFGFINNAHRLSARWIKYTAMNLQPLGVLGTMEFRQMHGTADMAKLTTWTNMIGALFREAVRTPLEDLITMVKNLNSTSEYEMMFYRLFDGVLTYNVTYREKMEEGIIFAKFCLVGYKVPIKEAAPIRPMAGDIVNAFYQDPELFEPVRPRLNIRPVAIPQVDNELAGLIRAAQREVENNRGLRNPWPQPEPDEPEFEPDEVEED